VAATRRGGAAVAVGGWRETHCFCHWSDGRRQLLRNGDQRLSRANGAVPHVGPHRGRWCGLDATGPPAATASAEGGHVARRGRLLLPPRA